MAFSPFNIFVFLTLSVFYHSSVAQSKVDSLKSALASGASKPERASVLLELTFELLDVNNIECKSYAEEGYQLSKDLGDSVKIVRSGRLLGQVYRRLDRMDESCNVLRVVLPIAERHHLIDEELKILNALAINYTFYGQHDKALAHHFKALVISENTGKNERICLALTNIGLVYYKLGDWIQALHYYQRAMDLALEIGYTYDVSRRYINMGLCLNNLNAFEKARTNFSKALKICGTECGPEIEVEAFLGIGMSYFTAGEYKSSRKFFWQSYVVAHKNGLRRIEAENLIKLSNIDIRDGSVDDALMALIKCEQVLEGTGYNEVVLNLYNELCKVFLIKSDFANLADYQTKYIRLYETIHSADFRNNLSKLEAEYLERENQSKVKSQKEIIILKDRVIEQQKNLMSIAIILAITLLMAAALLIHSRNVKQRMNKVLEEKIIKRTNALSQNFNHLNSTYKEYDAVIKRMRQEIQKTAGSVNQLCELASQDSNVAVNYVKIRQIESCARDLSSVLNNFIID